MRPRAQALPIAIVLALAGCSSPTGPYCAQIVGDDGGIVPGAGTALCRDLHEQPVCDAPGDTARFERDGLGRTQLVGGSYAICDMDLTVVCADRSVGPRCIRELE